jgi:hypothetical protein
MARFFEHVGEHNGKKVVIIEKSIPGEPHMCAVVYSTNIPSKFHDDIMKLLESAEGQAEKEFGLILNRRTATDGRNLLQAIAQEGYLKKAPTAQVIVKPNASSAIRLDELNKLLHMAGEGAEAIEKLEKLERESGFKDSRKNPTSVTPAEAAANIMDDTTLAANYVSQATRMKAEAQRLLAEAQRLEDEAVKLNPALNKKKVSKSGRNSKVAA